MIGFAAKTSSITIQSPAHYLMAGISIRFMAGFRSYM
jgi:hypothetical protein